MTDQQTNNSMSRRQVLSGATVVGAATVVGTTVLGTSVLSTNANAQAQPQQAALPDMGSSQAPTITDPKDKVAYIIGGSSGIGLGIAKVFFDAGMKVVIGYYSDRHIAEALKQFPENHPRVFSVRLDVMERDAWPKVADTIEDHFGAVNILVNNAGVGLQAPASTGTLNDWDWGMGVNLMGPIYGINTFVPRMLASKQGCHIVTTTSTSGILPGSGAGIYTVSKIAAVGLMEELRHELRQSNIGTSAFVPGLTTSNIGDSESARPESLRNNEGDVDVEAVARPPAGARPPARPAPSEELSPGARRPHDPVTAGHYVLNGILNNDLFIVAQPEWKAGVEARCNALLESMNPFKPLPESMYQRNLTRTPIYVQEVAHRRATQNRKIEGI